MHAAFWHVVFVLNLSAKERLVRKWRVERDGTSNASTSRERRLAGAEDTDVDGREVARFQPKAAHVQPFFTAFTLHHSFPLVCVVANASCAIH